MEKVNNTTLVYSPEIFKANDIRGVYGKDFKDNFAWALAKVLRGTWGEGKILLGQDDRSFSDELIKMMVNGLEGKNYEYLGPITTPFFNFVLGKGDYVGGVMVTASHNNQNYAGFKIFDGRGEIIGQDGLEKLKEKIDKINPAGAMRYFEISTPAFEKYIGDYTEFIIKESKVKEGEIGNLGINISGPETVVREAKYLSQKFGLAVDSHRDDISLIFDEDSDRIYFIDQSGQEIRTDYIIALLAENEIKEAVSLKVVHELRFSRGVIEKLHGLGVKTFPSKVGRFFVKAEAEKHKADLAGELSGHIYFKNNDYNELPLLTALKVLKILTKSKKNLAELVRPYKTWFSSGVLDFKLAEIPKTLIKKYADGKKSELDGLTIEYPNWWFNVRLSHTEPLLRLVVEAREKWLLDEKTAEISQLLREATLLELE